MKIDLRTARKPFIRGLDQTLPQWLQSLKLAAETP
jgi:hypothetical protein